MKRGEIYAVYQKPITKEQREGIARLIRRVQVEPNGFETWMVNFDEGDGEQMRQIDPKDFTGYPKAK